MTNLTSSLSDYTSPNYVIDQFPTYRNGKRSISYIYAGVYNKIASSIIASQTRCVAIIPTLGLIVPVSITLYLPDGVTDIPYTKTDGSTPLAWVVTQPGDGEQNGISDAVISTSIIAGSGQVAVELFYGKKTMSAASTSRIAYRWYERRMDPSQGEGPCLVGNWHNGSLWENNNSYTSNIEPSTFQDKNLSTIGRPLRLHLDALIATPYRARPNWFNHSAADKISPVRIIIGACRASTLGTQNRKNREVYQPSAGVTGHISVPSPHLPEGKTLLGPGACLMTGTFWIIQDGDTSVSSRRNKFHCYPSANAPIRHALPNKGEFYAQVFVLGKKA